MNTDSEQPIPTKEDKLPTKERLAHEIDAVARRYGDEGLVAMARRAREGYYDDYESPLAMPCVKLVEDFRFLGYEGMARKAMDGRWDGSREEGEAWAARQTEPDILEVLEMMKG